MQTLSLSLSYLFIRHISRGWEFYRVQAGCPFRDTKFWSVPKGCTGPEQMNKKNQRNKCQTQINVENEKCMFVCVAYLSRVMAYFSIVAPY